MKKKRESGKGLGNSAGVDVYHRGEYDAYHKSGNHSGEYGGHLRHCYRNGYIEGQRRRAAEKQRSKT